MANLNFINFDFNGVMDPKLSQNVTSTASDLGLWDIVLGNGFVKFATLDVVTTVQDGSAGSCAVPEVGDDTITETSAELQEFAFQRSYCHDKMWKTDYDVTGAYLGKKIDTGLMRRLVDGHVDAYSLDAELKRWSGNKLSAVPALQLMDGIMTVVRAKGVYPGVVTGYRQVNAASVLVTAANVIDQIKATIDTLDEKVINHKDFKIVVSQRIGGLLRQASQIQVGNLNLPIITGRDAKTGLITDNFYSFRVYSVAGLDQYDDGTNVGNTIMAGIFSNDGINSSIKLGMNFPGDERNAQVRSIEDGDKMQIKLFSAQAVMVVPNASQISVNH